MSSIKSLIYLLLFAALMFSCGSDDTDMGDIDCLLNDIVFNLTPEDSVDILNISYDEDGRIVSSGLREWVYTYNEEGNIDTATLFLSEDVIEFEIFFTYEDGRLISAVQTRRNPDLGTRYAFELIYDGAYLDSVKATSIFGDYDMNFDFDEHGNVLTYSDWRFQDSEYKFTYDTDQLGLFENPLSHTQALVLSISTGSFFYFWNDAPSTLMVDDTLYEYTRTFNESGLLSAIKADGELQDYTFEYSCD